MDKLLLDLAELPEVNLDAIPPLDLGDIPPLNLAEIAPLELADIPGVNLDELQSLELAAIAPPDLPNIEMELTAIADLDCQRRRFNHLCIDMRICMQ